MNTTYSDNAHRTPTPTPRRKRGAWHIVAIVFGCLMIVPGLAIVAGGGALALGQAVATDDDGYFHFTLDRIESDGVAVATTDLWLDDVEGDASPWVFDWLDVDLRLRVEGAVGTDDVFVGIARSADVERYLDGADYSKVVELDDRTPRYRQVTGFSSIAAPLEQDFWSASTAGGGEQELDWEARGGRWSVVVMNTDGSPVVAADVEIGARSGAVTPIAITLLVLGGLITATAITLFVIGVRGRKTPTPPAEDLLIDTSTPLPPPAPETAAQLDDEIIDEREASPVG